MSDPTVGFLPSFSQKLRPEGSSGRNQSITVVFLGAILGKPQAAEFLMVQKTFSAIKQLI